jgi:diguanylate cyclase (GGDEF)-like protein
MSSQPEPHDEGPPIRVLLIEPDAAEAERLRGCLQLEPRRFEVGHAPSLETALALLGADGCDAVVLALSQGADGSHAVARVREISSLPVVCITDHAVPDLLMAAVRAGARDCLVRAEAQGPLLVRAVLHAVERERLEEELRDVRARERFLATHDPLTGLPNRFAFEDRLKRKILRAAQLEKHLAVLFVGLDRFRMVNDTTGHGAGDELLVQVSERLRRAVRRTDGVARVGGDEFVTLLYDVRSANNATRVARKLEDLLSEPFRVEGHECWITPSIGIAMFPRDGAEPEALMRASYTAMREVKARGGGGQGFYTAAMRDLGKQRMQLETRLRRALEADELQLFYQPKVETDTGRIVGAEGLLRWTDAELGVVEPKTVIPVAEETGLIAAIGQWSLHTACMQNAQWQRAGFGPLRMSVNLSPRQMADERIRESVVRALWDSGLDASLLELEITENCLVENEEAASRLLEQLKGIGVAVSLDDFGTGFSSLSYLKRFPVDILKIDQSFVRDIAVDPDDAAIVSAIISIAQNLDLGVIAEGVETEEQLAFLRGRGCPEMQGFLMSPAVPAKEFTEMLKRQAERG